MSMSALNSEQNESTPMFSVIMPCYNSAAYVENALSSLMNQTCGDFEMIVINDGSTDDTPAILEAAAAKDARIKVFSKPNGGYVSAINLGLSKISGRYFLLLGSDDSLDTELFANIKAALRDYETEPDMIAFRSIKIMGSERKAERALPEAHALFQSNILEYEKKYGEDEVGLYLLRDTARCYKTALLKDLRYRGKSGVDADSIFSSLFAHRCSSFLTLPIDGYYWTLRKDSVSATHISFERVKDLLQCWNQYFDDVAESGYTLTVTENQTFMACYIGHVRRLTRAQLRHRLSREDRPLLKQCKRRMKQLAATYGWPKPYAGSKNIYARIPYLPYLPEVLPQAWKRITKRGSRR